MKIFMYEVREDDNSDMVKGCEGVSILGQGKIDEELLNVYNECGVKHISTRTIGFNHIDLAYAYE